MSGQDPSAVMAATTLQAMMVAIDGRNALVVTERHDDARRLSADALEVCTAIKIRATLDCSKFIVRVIGKGAVKFLAAEEWDRFGARFDYDLAFLASFMPGVDVSDAGTSARRDAAPASGP